MLKLIRYLPVMLIALVLMSYTKYSITRPAAVSPSALSSDTINTTKEDASSLFANASYYYKVWDLANAGLSENAFVYALKGFDHLSNSNALINKNILTIVDYSKPSSEKRLYVLDLVNGKILYNTLVAHGRNSGAEYANQFSNSPESHQSSLGFYITLGTYVGGNGYSLRLQGCEKGINDKALARAIVVHGADYVSNQFISSRGFLGRSYGCPSLPPNISREIINVIKNGSCLFVYHPSNKYFSQSQIINSQHG